MHEKSERNEEARTWREACVAEATISQFNLFQKLFFHLSSDGEEDLRDN